MLRQRDVLAALLRPKPVDTFGGHRLSAHHPCGPCSSPTLFADLMASLHEQYVVTPYVLATASSVPSYNPLRSSYHASITPRKTLEQVEHVIYPFRYGDTAPIVWEALSGVTNDQPGINYNSVDLQDDSFRLELTIDVQLERKRADFHLQTVAKRIADSRRTVIVWTGIALPLGVGGKSMDGISIRQRGWAVVEPVASSELASGSTSEATRSMTYVEDEILIEDSVKKKGSNMALLQQFLMGIYAREGVARRQLTENKLVEKTMRAGRVMAA